METKSWSKRRALSLCDQPVACCPNSKSALEHVFFLLCKVAYDWRTSWSLARSNWLHLVMSECILASAVPEALTFLHKKQNLDPPSPLEAHTCFWAAPSARIIPKSKWNLMVVFVFWSFKIMPACGKFKGLQKSDFKRLAMIWLTPASNLDTLVLLVIKLWWASCVWKTGGCQAPRSCNTKPMTFSLLGLRRCQAPIRLSTLWASKAAGVMRGIWHAQWNKAIKYVSRLVKTNGTGSPW